MSKAISRNSLSYSLYLADLAVKNANFDQAILHLQDAVSLQPKNPDVLCGLAQAYEASGDTSKSKKLFEKAEKYGLADPSIKVAFGTFYLNHGLYEQAQKKYHQAIHILRNYSGSKRELLLKISIFNLAVAYRKLNQLELAIEQYNKFIKLFGRSEDALFNLAIAFDAKGEFNDAIALYNELLKKKSDDLNIKLNLAETLNASGSYKEAEAVFGDILSRDALNNKAKFGLGLLLLKKRNWAEGWSLYLKRWNDERFIGLQNKTIQNCVEYFSPTPYLTPISNKKVLILGEQGIGDVVMFSSYIKNLKTENNITLVCDQRLIRLFSWSMQDIKTISYNDFDKSEVKNFDLVVPIGNLPTISKVTESPYLSPSKSKSEQFKRKLNLKKKLVGISWRGGLVTTRVRQRSIDLDYLLSQFTGENYQFVNLQYGEAREEINPIAKKYKLDVVSPFAQEIDDLDDLATLIDNLDVVLTVQNTNVHISGAIGKKCIVMLPSTPEWRYGLRDNTMPWYKDVKLLRQDQKDNWMPVIDRASVELELILRGEH